MFISSTGPVHLNANKRCYSEQNKKQTHSKKEHFSSPLPNTTGISPVSAQLPVTRSTLAPCHPGSGLGSHPWSVKLGSEHKRGYLVQFTRRPPHIKDVVCSLVQINVAHILHSEVKNLLAKELQRLFLQLTASQAFTATISLFSRRTVASGPSLISGI